jgi:hypothetical protein
LLPLGYSITGSAKGVDVKAFKIAAFRASMRRQYTSRTLQVEWPLGVQAVQKRLVARCRAAVGICGFQLQESGVIEPLW